MGAFRTHSLLVPLIAGTILVATMGPSCPVTILVPVAPEPVTVELVNHTEELVPPKLYLDPATVDTVQDMRIPDNFFDLGPPLEVGETADLEFACEDAGSIYSDDWDIIMTLPDGTLAGPGTILHEGEDYFCGETVRISYELPVTINFFNDTSNPVNAFLWANPGTLTEPEDMVDPANLVDAGPTLAAGAFSPIALECFDAGTLLADGDLVLVPAGTLASSNVLLMNEGQHFFCGDRVSVFYEVDGDGDFFMTAEVNDHPLP